MFSYKRVGGLRFLRLGRLSLSWCVTKPRPRPAPRPVAAPAVEPVSAQCLLPVW